MKSFLVVDDDPTMTALYEALIRKRYDDALVSQAHNGKEALCKAIDSDCSVIISDVNMPTMNGIDFHRSVKKKSSLLAQRTAFISATPDIPYFNKEKIPYLLKPFEINNFYSLIDSILALEEKNLNKEMGYTLQREYERRDLKEECILEPLNMELKGKRLIKGTIVDMSEGGFGFVYKGEGLSERFRVKVLAESIGVEAKKAEMIWANEFDGGVRSGFRWA